MKKHVLPASLLFAAIIFLGGTAFGQKAIDAKKSGAITKVANFAGHVTVIVVKSAGKAAWETTKFSAKNFAKPILLKAVPKVSMFALKLTGRAINKGIPVASKVGFTYLKAKLPF